MKKTLATVVLIILNSLAFSAGIWAAFGTMMYNVTMTDILPGVLFLTFLPSPLILVWRSLREGYGFSKQRFLLCTVLPPYIVTTAVNIVMAALAETIGSENGGWGGLALAALIIACGVATVGLTVSTVIWMILGERFERIRSDRTKKVLAIILLTLCSTIICGGLRGLLSIPMPRVSYVFLKTTLPTPRIVSYVRGILLSVILPAVPIGFGVSALMRIYREKYSLKAPLFLLCSFLPTLLISGGVAAAEYYRFGEKEYYFYHQSFIASIDTLLFTAAVAVIAAVIYAVTALIRGRQHGN